MPMYNLIEYGDNYSKTSGSLWQDYKDNPFKSDNGVFIDVQYFNLLHFLIWSEKFIIVTGDYGNREPKFAVIDAKLCVPVVTLSAQDNEKLLQQLKAGFKLTISCNKCQSEPTLQTRNRYLNNLIDPSLQRVSRFFVLSFENDAHRRSYKQYFLPTVEINDYNVIIDEKNFLDQQKKNDLRTYETIQKIATGQGDDYTIGCLLDDNYFKNCYKMIAIDLIKQQAFDANRRAVQLYWKFTSSRTTCNVFY